MTQAIELSSAYRGTAFLLGDVVEADDAYTGEHSRGVVELTLAVVDDARARRDRAAQRRVLRPAARRRQAQRAQGDHQQGRAASADEERDVIETHTVEGERILDQVGGVLGDVGRIVRSCHERWDGQGYPDGLAGDGDPAHRAHRLRLRRLQRDDDRPLLPRRALAAGRARRAARAAPARTSTRRRRRDPRRLRAHRRHAGRRHPRQRRVGAGRLEPRGKLRDVTQFWFAGSTEEFPPSEMLEQAAGRRAAGFDGIGCSDHFAPWFPTAAPRRRGSRGGLGPADLAADRHRRHAGDPPLPPGASIAQAFMAMEELYPGRVFLGVGSGEALNEVPLGLDWPEPGRCSSASTAGLEAIQRLWDGETVTMDGGWFRLKEAKLYTRAEAAAHVRLGLRPQAAAIAGRYGEGLWTLGDPDTAPEVIAAYREACSDNGSEAGDIILQSGFAWAATRTSVGAGARRWKPTQLPELYRDDIPDPAEMQRRADEQMSDEEFASEGFLVSATPTSTWRGCARSRRSGRDRRVPAADRPGRPDGHDRQLRPGGAAPPALSAAAAR